MTPMQTVWEENIIGTLLSVNTYKLQSYQEAWNILRQFIRANHITKQRVAAIYQVTQKDGELRLTSKIFISTTQKIVVRLEKSLKLNDLKSLLEELMAHGVIPTW